MIQTTGIQIIPGSVGTEVGQLEVDGKSEAAIVQTLVTQAGPVSIVWPVDAVDKLIEQLQEAKKEAQGKKSDIYIPTGNNETKAIIERSDAINKSKQN